MKKISYKHPNGYTGTLYGKSSLIVHDINGREVLHTGSRNINTFEELVNWLDSFPELIKIIKLVIENEGDEVIK